jgi:hypothetical protein
MVLRAADEAARLRERFEDREAWWNRGFVLIEFRTTRRG